MNRHKKETYKRNQKRPDCQLSELIFTYRTFHNSGGRENPDGVEEDVNESAVRQDRMDHVLQNNEPK